MNNQKEFTDTAEHVVFRISSSSNVIKTSDAILKSIQEGKRLELQALGAGAVNQAVKSIAAARGKLASSAIDLFCAIGFKSVEMEVGHRTVMIFKLLVNNL
jgi:stage V sporulation protein S